MPIISRTGDTFVCGPFVEHSGNYFRFLQNVELSFLFPLGPTLASFTAMAIFCSDGPLLFMPSRTSSQNHQTEPPNGTTCKTTNTWLVKVEVLSCGKVRVRNVLNGHPYQEAYSSAKKLLPKFLNLLDYRVKGLTIAYGLDYVQHTHEADSRVMSTVSF